jgi:phosphohistidine phosphatase
VIAVHLLRHADAGDPAEWDGPDDLRPISPKGRRQAERLGKHLAAVGYEVDAMLTSPRLRAVETARRVAAHLKVPVTEDARLAGPLEPAVLGAILADAGHPRSPMLVGHDPDFSALLTVLCGVNASLSKGSLARLDLDEPVEAGMARLVFLLPPRLLPR